MFQKLKSEDLTEKLNALRMIRRGVISWLLLEGPGLASSLSLRPFAQCCSLLTLSAAVLYGLSPNTEEAYIFYSRIDMGILLGFTFLSSPSSSLTFLSLRPFQPRPLLPFRVSCLAE